MASADLSLCRGDVGEERLDSVARWRNLIPSFPWIAPGWRAWGRNPRKGRDQILQRSIAEPYSFKPEEPNTYYLKFWLQPSGNHAVDLAILMLLLSSG